MRITKEEKLILFKRLMQDNPDYGQYHWAHASIELTRETEAEFTHLKEIIKAYKTFLNAWEEEN